MAHIHMGAAGVMGPVVVPFTPVINFTSFNTVGFANGVVSVDPMLAANITANPAGYYVNLHSVTYPNGKENGCVSHVAGFYGRFYDCCVCVSFWVYMWV